ncbi:hypothetical protein BDN67DRAFT_985957, partial [Paxillus ammoniavirescens]
CYKGVQGLSSHSKASIVADILPEEYPFFKICKASTVFGLSLLCITVTVDGEFHRDNLGIGTMLSGGSGNLAVGSERFKQVQTRFGYTCLVPNLNLNLNLKEVQFGGSGSNLGFELNFGNPILFHDRATPAHVPVPGEKASGKNKREVQAVIAKHLFQKDPVYGIIREFPPHEFG